MTKPPPLNQLPEEQQPKVEQNVPPAPEASSEQIDLTKLEAPGEDITFPFTSLSQGVVLKDWKTIREESARTVAQMLVWIFGLSILVVLAIAFVVFLRSDSPEEAKAYGEALAPILTGLASFASSVFAPLLAFILGYYYGEKQKEK